MELKNKNILVTGGNGSQKVSEYFLKMKTQKIKNYFLVKVQK